MLISLLSMCAYCGLKLVKLRSTLVDLAYENQLVNRRLQQVNDRLDLLRVSRSQLLVPQRLESFSGRHGYRFARGGQIIILNTDAYVEGDEHPDNER